MGDTEPTDDQLTIPDFLKRDSNNRAEFMTDEVATDMVLGETPKVTKPPKTKANGQAPVKAAGKPKKVQAKAPAKAKTAPKATAKAAKAPDKAKAAKPKASKVELDQYGLRKGSIKSKAAAMYARKSGATLGEVKDTLGSVQLNVLVALEGEGYEVIKEKQTRKDQRAVTRYWLKNK